MVHCLWIKSIFEPFSTGLYLLQQTPGNGAPADSSMAPGGGKAGQGMDPKPNTAFSHDSLNASTEEM